MLNRINKAMEDLGFLIAKADGLYSGESEHGVCYEKKYEMAQIAPSGTSSTPMVHVVYISQQGVVSYVRGPNKTGGVDAKPMSVDIMRLMIKKYEQMKRKYDWR